MKRVRVLPTGWYSVPAAVSTVIWSFVHIFDAPLMVPDKAQHQASRGAQRQLRRFRLDKKWIDNLMGRGYMYQHRLAQLFLSRFTPSKITTVRMDLKNAPTDITTFLLPICEACSGASVVDVYYDLTEYAPAVHLLTNGPRLTKLYHTYKPRTGMEVLNPIPIRSPGLTELFMNCHEQGIRRRVPPFVLARIECLINFTFRASPKLFESMPRLRSLETAFVGLNNGTDLVRLATALVSGAPQIRRVRITFADSMSYVPATSLRAFLPLSRLIKFELLLKEMVIWTISPSTEYDDFMLSALASWPDIERISLALPVTPRLWLQSATGGTKLRYIDFDTTHRKEAKEWVRTFSPNCRVRFN